MGPVDHAAFQQPALARAAGAVAAAVGQADALADGRGQDGFVAVDAEHAFGRLEGDLETHGHTLLGPRSTRHAGGVATGGL